MSPARGDRPEVAALIGARLRRARESAKVSAGDMAKRLGVSRQTIHAWESGSRVPGADQVALWSKACRVHVEALYPDDGDLPDMGEPGERPVVGMRRNPDADRTGATVRRTRTYDVLIERSADGTWLARCPQMPGLPLAPADDLAEARALAVEAIRSRLVSWDFYESEPPAYRRSVSSLTVTVDVDEPFDRRRYLTIPEAAERLGLSRASMPRIVHRGDLPTYSCGDRRYVSLADVEAYARRRHIGPGTDEAD